MKTARKIVIFASVILALTTLLALSVSAEDMLEEGVCGESITWTLNLNTGELILTGSGAMPDYGGENGSAPWYSQRDLIKSVTVWDGITTLGDYAFFNCRSLTDVTLPSGLQAVGDNVFSNCRALTEIELPARISSLGTGIFSGCNTLETVTLPVSITELPASTFSGCIRLKTVELPISLTALGNDAFFGCRALSEITLPSGLLTVGDNAFYSCAALTEIVLPIGVQSVGSEAFVSCGQLQSLFLPNTLTAIGDRVLTNTTPSTVLYYGSAEEWATVSLGSDNDVLTEALILHPDHSFDREIADLLYLKSEADCENPETYYKSCACGEMGEETFTYGEAWGHMGGEATCLELAICKVCWQPYGELGDHTPDGLVGCETDVHCTVCEALLEHALGHEHQATVTPPTCTEAGYTTHTCSLCGDSYTDTPVDATGHTAGDAATCTADQTCTVCGEILAARLGHDHLATVTLQPTCTEQGIMTYTCSRCEDTYTRPIAPNGHTPGAAATCTEAQLCTVCNARLTDKLGHNYGTQIMEPTCDERGYTVHECSRCGAAYVEDFVPAKGHTPGGAATCTEVQTCTVCAAVLADKLGHSYEKTVTEPTCLEQGYTTRTCSRCAHTYLDDFRDALGHKAGAAATCSEPQTCTRCHALLAEKLAHIYTDTVIPPTCTEPGYTLHVCNLCKNTYTDTVVAALEHTAGDWILDRNPGFGEAGKHHTECTVCGIALESETFLNETEIPTEPVTDENGVTQALVSETEEEGEASGCGQTVGNMLVIVLVLAAAFLFWYIDSRRRSR